MAENAELFGRTPVKTVRPITADMCTILWSPENPSSGATGGILTGATNINISYQQQVVRRRTLATANGTPLAAIYPTQPQGSIQIQRLFADLSSEVGSANNGQILTSVHDLFSFAGWNVCAGTAAITLNFDGKSAYPDCATKTYGYRMTGAIVTGYNISAEAEGLTVVDNVSIEFLQMFSLAPKK